MQKLTIEQRDWIFQMIKDSEYESYDLLEIWMNDLLTILNACTEDADNSSCEE